MINLIDGCIGLEKKHILAASRSEELDYLAEIGLLEKRKDDTGIYYYAEDSTHGMRFGIFIRPREKSIKWLVLRWLDGPCTSKGWNNVSEKAQKDEYTQLLKFVGNLVQRPPDSKKNRQQRWLFTWGQVEVSYEPRDFATHIFMLPC